MQYFFRYKPSSKITCPCPADLSVYVLDHNLGKQPHVGVSHPALEVGLGKLVGNLSHHQLEQQTTNSHRWVKVICLMKFQNLVKLLQTSYCNLFSNHLSCICLFKFLEDNWCGENENAKNCISKVAEDPSGATVCTTQWNKTKTCYTIMIKLVSPTI